MFNRCSRTAFTRADLLAAIALVTIVLVYGVALTGCGGLVGAGISSQQQRVQNGKQIREIHNGMLLFAQGNKTLYPGLIYNAENQGKLDGSIKTRVYGAAAFDDANPTAMVYALLLTGRFIAPESAVSPIESRLKAEPGPTPITSANYSYALLKVTNKTSDKGRRLEWTDSANSQAPIAGDRSKAIDPSLKTTSIHVSSTSADSADWEGNIVWNDHHVTFEETGKLQASTLKFGQTADIHSTELDDLFSGAAVGKFDETTNALFAY